MSKQIKRLIISFSARCALNCSYCYAPFNKILPTKSLLLDVLAFAKAEAINVLTFGGGDPFQYGITRDILRKSRELNFFVHVDTHCIGLKESDYELLHESVDLVGLPLDGPRATHDLMRARTGHFEIVVAVLKRLVEQQTRVKVNTMVARSNRDLLIELARDVKIWTPDIWSLYQFMELPGKMSVNNSHRISHKSFIDTTTKLKEMLPEIKIETGTPDRRRTGYLFVRTDGMLFTHASSGVGYLELGDIYSNAWRERFETMNRSMLPELSKSRYEYLMQPTTK